MKNKFKTLKLFSGAAVMATLCFMASGVGATRVAEDNNIHDIACYEERNKEAETALDRMSKAYDAEVEAILRGCDESYKVGIEALLNGYDVKNSVSRKFFNEREITTIKEIIAIVIEAAKDTNFTLSRYEKRHRNLLYKRLDESWDFLQPPIFIQLASATKHQNQTNLLS